MFIRLISKTDIPPRVKNPPVKVVCTRIVTRRPLQRCTCIGRRSKSDDYKLQRVLNAAARVVSGTHKFDRGLSRLLHTELHWLNVPERVAFKLILMVFNCLHNQALQYLVDLCQSVSSVVSRQHLSSANRGLLSCLAIVSAVTVGGLFLWPALRYGTGYHTV